MSVLTLPEDWSGPLDALVDTANQLLPFILPLARTGRSKDEVNARLVRHYTTERLLDESLRQGREARYTRRHLLQLLALRKLMADGFGTAALQNTLQARTDLDLEALIMGESQLRVQPGNPALDYLQQLKRPAAAAGSPSPVPAAPRSASPAPSLPEAYTRLTLQPGLELHVRTDAHLPRSQVEQQRLTQLFLDALDRLRRPK
ncbi:MerR family transcriptional regulator [Deinococcus sp. HMF7620]|uniref:MerR family transcriptional regulator n=1 Tax=Deinococcus arboris TaxID=2682977 RepID=A0A7C9HTS8_9DEIO|nr:MerR family transcriptional regulator [Deinococcus arboris]MVN88507.1 MerR family transcriptional regulator [Deinococcus arboris]